MVFQRILTIGAAIISVLIVAGCDASRNPDDYYKSPTEEIGTNDDGENIWDIFANVEDPNITLEVNKYIWNASLDVLNFMPIQAADPFSGVLVTGYGTPPGGGRSYRATVYIQDPALDARSLNVALYTQSGPASADAVRAVEDAILTRARQLRQADANL